jgi:hypothetical protein
MLVQAAGVRGFHVRDRLSQQLGKPGASAAKALPVSCEDVANRPKGPTREASNGITSER